MQKALLGIVLAFIGATNLVSTAFAEHSLDGTRVEVPLKAFLAPETGYEEKNNVQAVLYGFLPNACYTLADYTVEKQSDGHSILVRQYAFQDDSGICADSDTMPDHMKMRVPFTTEISMGSLKPGSYRFIYNKKGDGEKIRALTVSNNISPNVDTLPYAAVSAAQAQDVINGKDHVKVSVSGVLNSSCTELNEEVQVLYENDVFVLLPTVKVKRGVLCAQMLIPFTKEVDLGSTFPGVHLIHTRSMNGKSVNKVIMVSR